MDTVKIDTNSVTQTANEILDSLTIIEDYITQINQNMDNITRAWRGIDADRYIDAIKFNYVTELNNLKECIESYRQYLSMVPGKYIDVDTDGAADIGAVEV